MSETDRLLMIDLSGPALTPDERAFLRERRPGGVCLFRRNIRDRYQVAEYTAELHELCGEDLLVATDQEGGGVIRAHDVPYSPGAMALGAADDVRLTREVAAATARGLRAMGVNVDFAPCADVNNNPQNPVIADRSFGGDPAHVSRHVAAFVEGLQGEGVAAVAKHFPGHGDTDTDSHLALPTLPYDMARLEAVELAPFRAAIQAGASGVMSAHIVVPTLDAEVPATLSRPVLTGLLREKLGFEGVIFTDALDMKAISERYGPTEAAVRAVAAGVDMPVHIGPVREHEAIVEAFARAVREGRLDAEEVSRSAGRVAELSRRYPARPNPDAAWREGDEALLKEAARRAVVKLGDLRPLPPGARLTVVAAERVATSAASQLVVSPARALVAALEEAGFSVTYATYDREAPAEGHAAVLEAVAGGDVALFVSTARTRMSEGERSLAQEVARRAKAFVHVALWNPYHVFDLPGPALVTFGFREGSARAAARALVTGEAVGKAPVRLEPAPPQAMT